MISHCLYCEIPIFPKTFLCNDCKIRLEKAKFDSFMIRCKFCGFPKVSDDYNCINCKTYPELKAYPIFDYTDSFAREFLELYKFEGHKEYAKIFANILKNYIKPNQIIVPIPSSNTSIKKRGWDQMLQITRYLKNETCSILVNKEDTKIQSKQLNREERQKFSKNKFTLVNKGLPNKDSELLILDDVFTTGSTIYSAFLTLRDSGYTKISAITLYAEL